MIAVAAEAARKVKPKIVKRPILCDVEQEDGKPLVRMQFNFTVDVNGNTRTNCVRVCDLERLISAKFCVPAGLLRTTAKKRKCDDSDDHELPWCKTEEGLPDGFRLSPERLYEVTIEKGLRMDFPDGLTPAQLDKMGVDACEQFMYCELWRDNPLFNERTFFDSINDKEMDIDLAEAMVKFSRYLPKPWFHYVAEAPGGGKGQNCFMKACYCRHDLAEQMWYEGLVEGADINFKNKWGASPLTACVEFGHEKLCLLILDCDELTKETLVDTGIMMAGRGEHNRPGEANARINHRKYVEQQALVDECVRKEIDYRDRMERLLEDAWGQEQAMNGMYFMRPRGKEVYDPIAQQWVIDKTQNPAVAKIIPGTHSPEFPHGRPVLFGPSKTFAAHTKNNWAKVEEKFKEELEERGVEWKKLVRSLSFADETGIVAASKAGEENAYVKTGQMAAEQNGSKKTRDAVKALETAASFEEKRKRHMLREQGSFSRNGSFDDEASDGGGSTKASSSKEAAAFASENGGGSTEKRKDKKKKEKKNKGASGEPGVKQPQVANFAADGTVSEGRSTVVVKPKTKSSFLSCF